MENDSSRGIMARRGMEERTRRRFEVVKLDQHRGPDEDVQDVCLLFDAGPCGIRHVRLLGGSFGRSGADLLVAKKFLISRNVDPIRGADGDFNPFLWCVE
jgi:hypothetical protein